MQPRFRIWNNKRPMGHIAHLRKQFKSLNIWTNLNFLHPRKLFAKFGWNWSSGSGEEDENVKILQTDGRTDGQTDRQTTDNRWSEKLTWAFSSGELKSEQAHIPHAPTLHIMHTTIMKGGICQSGSTFVNHNWILVFKDTHNRLTLGFFFIKIKQEIFHSIYKSKNFIFLPLGVNLLWVKFRS